MKKYSVLIIGIQCYYGHIREFIINLKKTNPLVDITLVTSNMSDEVEKELNQYTKSIIHHKSFLGRFRIRPLVMMVNMYYYFKEFILLRLRGRFDIVNIHFANRHIKFAMPFIKMMTKNIVISPWGSDVLRVEGDKVIGDLRKIYSQANYVTVGKDSQIGKYLIERFNVDSRKMVKLGWGGESFDYIQSNKDRISVEEAKERFGLSGRYVITCGYNTQKEQRHEKIIEAVYSVKNQLPDNLVLLFPFTYGKTTNSDIYTESIIEKCKQMGLCAMPVYEHLDLEDLLKLRMATDVFVHVQTTDAGSRCVMEYVQCNKKVIHGRWMKYKYLEDYRPSCYFPVERMEDLAKCLIFAYHAEISDLPQEVTDIIMRRSWNYKMALWNDFFESIV